MINPTPLFSPIKLKKNNGDDDPPPGGRENNRCAVKKGGTFTVANIINNLNTTQTVKYRSHSVSGTVDTTKSIVQLK